MMAIGEATTIARERFERAPGGEVRYAWRELSERRAWLSDVETAMLDADGDVRTEDAVTAIWEHFQARQAATWDREIAGVMKRVEAQMWSPWYDGPGFCEQCDDLAVVGVTGLPETDQPVDLCFQCVDEMSDDYDVHWLDRDGEDRTREWVEREVERTCP